MNHIESIIPLVLAIFGSFIGCYFSFHAAKEALPSIRQEEQSQMRVLATIPLSQMLYGLLLFIVMNNKIDAGELASHTALMVGAIAGLLFFFPSIFQGKIIASGCQQAMQQPPMSTKIVLWVGVLESIALFAFIASLLVISA